MAKVKPPAFQFYADDFLSGTIGMTPSEVGCYIRLLCAQWNTGSLPDDVEILTRLGGAMPTPYVLSKFRKVGLALKNPRMEVERRKQNAFRVKRSESGKKGANARWQTHGDAIAPPMANDSSPSPSPSPDNIDIPVELPPGFPKTVDDAVSRCSSSGVSALFITDCWNKAMGRGGADAKGQRIRSFPHHVKFEWNCQQNRTAEKANSATLNGYQKQPQKSILEKDIDRL